MSGLLDWLRGRTAEGAHLCLDSRRVTPGDVFLACPGAAADGREFIEQAIAAGACAVVYEAAGARPVPAGVPALAVDGLRARLGELASAWYGEPSRRLAVIAVTGTNGKTSCTHWIAQALGANGQPCGVIGTLGVRLPDGQAHDTGLTTPDVVTLHRALADMVRAGAVAVAIEASSIGLEQGRLDGAHVSVAAFTNLSRDHLDAHGDMQAYEAAKARLFAWPGLEAAVVNAGNPAGRRMLAGAQAGRVLGVRCEPLADAAAPTGVPMVEVPAFQVTAQGTEFNLRAPDGAEALVRTTLPGAYNVENLLVVAGVLHVLGWPLERVGAALTALAPVPGRMQAVDAAAGPLVVVDYAHTPDALASALAALRPLTTARGGRLWCVFGCGGDRDPGKRAPMGAAALAGADAVVVTSDNPRSEDPAAIIEQILAGMDGTPDAPPSGATVEPDRALAILHAVWRSAPEDVVLLAGKGHEATQDVGGVKHVFHDAEWARLGLMLPAMPKVGTDTRDVTPGELFVALAGERFDAHDFLDAAAAGGAAAAVVARPLEAPLPTIVLGDTRQALLRIAAAWRARFALPLVGVTGSNGKTTTKEMIAAILAAWHGLDQVLATRGNLNNDIGVPLTLLRLRASHRSGVVELGMNHPGEIAVLAQAAAPTIALVNNAQREHQEFMHTVEAVARENGAALAALPADGVAVYPGDDAYTGIWDELAGARSRLRFGFGESVDVSADDVAETAGGTRFMLRTPAGSAPVALGVAGRHNLRNALAAAACALAAGCPLDAVADGLGGFAAVKGRMQLQQDADGNVLIDDTYNANPDSVRAAIDVLAGLPGPRALVLGDMGEVGENGPAMHREVGAYARERGIEHLFALGEATRDTVAAFGAGAVHADTPEAAAALVDGARARAVLVKGSRFMRMERVVTAVQAARQSSGAGHAA